MVVMNESQRKFIENIFNNFHKYGINDWEYNFIKNILRKNTISKKQADIIKRIYMYAT